MIQFSFPIGYGQYITLQAERPLALSKMYDQLGGNSDNLMDRIGESIADPDLNAPAPFVPAETPPSESTQGDAHNAGGKSSPSDDPWGDENTPTEGSGGDDDPWGEPAATPMKPKSNSSARSSEESAKSNSADSRQSSSHYDNFGRKWTDNVPGAPECFCGDPASKMEAKSKAGKRYTKWNCQKAGSESEWRDKCDFSEFAN